MPPKAPDASDGGDAERKAPAGSPRGELARLREEERQQRTQVRAEMMEAMLLAAGERGLRAVTVEDVLSRYGGNRAQFYRHFANLSECFVAAYAEEVERLCGGMLRAGAAAESWREGLHGALGILATFVSERPLVARALAIDVHLAGEPAQELRKEMYERLSHAIDSARRETESRHSPPPLTADFMVSAIDAAVVAALVRGDPATFVEAVPELENLVASAYFGDY
jgi:AcrR family transcriptional regulator